MLHNLERSTVWLEKSALVFQGNSRAETHVVKRDPEEDLILRGLLPAKNQR